jgi:hypothetical protein
MTTHDDGRIWQQLQALFPAPATVIDFTAHEVDQSIEVFFDPATPATWVPGEAALRAVCALGFATVYCVFADETEFVGGFRLRAKAPGSDTWVMSPRRDRCGTPRYGGRDRPKAILIHGEDAKLWPEFVAWRTKRGFSD